MSEPQEPREELDKDERGELERQSRDLWSKILALQERFSYFVLAASGSAAVFAVVKTGEWPRGCWILPAMAAIVTWGVCFILSACHLQLKVMALLGDRKALEIRLGREPITSQRPELVPEALQRLDRDKRQNDRKSAACARWALYLLLLGGIFYLIAHLQRLRYPDVGLSGASALSTQTDAGRVVAVSPVEPKRIAPTEKDSAAVLGPSTQDSRAPDAR